MRRLIAVRKEVKSPFEGVVGKPTLDFTSFLQLSRAPKWAFPFVGVLGEKKNHRPYRTMILFLSLCLGLPALRSYQQGAANLQIHGGLGALEGSFRFLFRVVFFLLPSLCFADDWTREDTYR